MRRALLLLLVLAVAAGGGYWWWTRPAAEEQANRGGRRRGNNSDPVAVVAAVSKTADVPVYLDGLGTVQAFNTVNVRAMVDGPLIEVRFREGQEVKAGDVLARIDPRPFQATLDQNVAKKRQDEATLANARLDAGRYAKLAATAYSSAQQSDTARSQVAQLTAQVAGDQAQVDSAQTQLGYTTILAPIDGRTGLRQVDSGNIVHPGGGGTVLDRGKLAVLDNQVDPTTGTIKLKATFPNPDRRLWPGGFVNVRLLSETLRGVTTIPVSAVQRGPRGSFVYVITPDMTATRRPVTVSTQDEQVAVIAEGLDPGEQVVTDGASRLSENSKVAIARPDGVAPDAVPSQQRRRGPGTAEQRTRRGAS